MPVLSTLESEDDERADTLADRVLAEVLQRIGSGVYQPGSIVNELELARSLAVSRGPVREALRRLEGRKLVVRTPFAKARVVSLGPAEIREVFEMREALEGMATRLACLKMSDGDLNALVREVETSARSLHSFDLHRRIAEMCGNSRIRSILCDELYYLLLMYRRQSGASPGRRAQAQEEHWQIAVAMQQRNSALAGSLMCAHIRRATDRLAKDT